MPRVDWAAPWNAPLAAWGRPVDALRHAGATVAQALDAVSGPAGPRFVAAQALAPGTAYETHVATHGAVPTRDNLHDLFNGLVWLAQPALKARLAALHAAEIARRGRGPARGALRDALTLFDENGATLEAPPALADALRRRDWAALFVAGRAAWRDARITLVGHGLLERLLQPRPAITAHVLLGPPAQAFADGRPPALWPLPVLGIPGWWEPNADPGFYGDVRVFRPPRLKAATAAPSER